MGRGKPKLESQIEGHPVRNALWISFWNKWVTSLGWGILSSAGEHLKSNTKEFQPLQPVTQLHQGLNLNVSMLMHVAWGIKTSKKCVHTCRTVTSLALQRYCGMSPMAGELEWKDMLFRKDRHERWGGVIILYVNEHLECMELCQEMDEKLTESLWFRIKGRTGTL